MKTFLAFAFCALAAAASAEAPPAPNPGIMDFSGFVSAWRQDCADDCAPPAAEGSSRAAGFVVGVPQHPGEARVAKFDEDFAFAAGEKIKASFTVYFVCPRGAAAASGDDGCPAKYLQVQAALTGDARAFCAASLNVGDAAPFPVMMCAGENLRRPGERLGVSLSRQALADL